MLLLIVVLGEYFHSSMGALQLHLSRILAGVIIEVKHERQRKEMRGRDIDKYPFSRITNRIDASGWRRLQALELRAEINA